MLLIFKCFALIFFIQEFDRCCFSRDMEEVRGRLLLHDGREVELTAGADIVMGRGGSSSALPLGINDKRCSRRQAVLTFLPPSSPSDPPFALVAVRPLPFTILFINYFI
jgi:hypothetical protein